MCSAGCDIARASNQAQQSCWDLCETKQPQKQPQLCQITWKMPIIWSLLEKLISREKGTYIFIITRRYVEAHVDLFYGWIWPCSMCTCMLKTASSFSTECIIFARFILISSWWFPDYTESFYCRSCWSLQKKKKQKRDWHTETVELLFCGDRRDAPACRFVFL